MKKMLIIVAGLSLAAQSLIAQNSSAVGSISAPSAVSLGASFSATITMTNTGGTTWTSASLYNLGSEIPRDTSRWGLSRIVVPADINPGDVAVFTTTFTAPTQPGVYNFSWEMVQDGVEWFGPIASTTIKVGSPQFVPGDLVVLQIGDGSRTIASSGTPMFLNNFSLSGHSNTFQVAIPLTGSNAIITGISPFTGMIDLSTDKRFIVLEGYNTNLLWATTSLETSAAALRAAGTVDGNGNFTFNVSTPVYTTGGTIRGTVSDGLGNFWAGAQNSGIQYLGTNFAPSQISKLDPTGINNPASVGAIRNMMMVNGKPYLSSSQYPAPGTNGISAFPSVAPTSPEDPVFVIDARNIANGGPINGTGTPNIKGFYVNSNLTIAYVVDMRTSANGGGIYRYNGTGTGLAGSWTYQYTITNNLFSNGGAFQEVIADCSGVNPKIYATAGAIATGSTAGTNLVSAIDTGAATTTFTLLQTAPAGTTFHGLTFAPTVPAVSPVLSISQSGSNVIITWTGGGTLRSSTDVAGSYTPVAGSPSSPYTNSAVGTTFYRVSIP